MLKKSSLPPRAPLAPTLPRALAATLAATMAAGLLSGCVAIQKVPVSTDPQGAVVYLDGKQACAATPCSVEASNDQDHLLTIMKDGYRQKDIPLRLTKASGGGIALSPSMVTLTLSKPGELNVRDADSVMDTAVGMGMEVLKQVFEVDRKGGQDK